MKALTTKLRAMVGLLGLLFALQTATRGADGFWLLGEDLGLSGQKGWNNYSGGDSPEGAYLGWFFEGETALTGTINLKRTIPPGTYNVLLKTHTYVTGGQIELQLGDAKGMALAENRDWNRQWTMPITLTITVPASNVVIRPVKIVPVEEAQKYLVRGIYITTNRNENVPLYGDERIVDWGYPTVTNSPAQYKDNLVRNGSFEVGIGYGWGFLAEGYNRERGFQESWDRTVGFHGNSSFRFLAKSAQLISRIYRVRPNRVHTLSAWVRAEGPSGAGLRIYNVATPPPDFPPVVDTNKSFAVNSTWQRISLTAYLPDYPHSDYQFIISGNSQVWVDAIQLEEGTLTDYKAPSPIEVGFQSNVPGRIMFDDQSPALDMVVYNHSAIERSATVMYEIFDAFNRNVGSGRLTNIYPGRQLTTKQFPLTSGTRGIQRIVSWIPDSPHSMEEVVFAVVPRPSVMGTNDTSNMGIHPNFVAFEMLMHQRLGFKWARALSPEGIFRWASIEPVEGQITFHDDRVDRVKNFGMTVMGTIGSNFEWPTWADVNGQPNLDKWESFVERLVTHYKGKVSYWEIWNEPIYAFTPQQYAPLLQRAALAIRRADPSAKIVGMGGVHSRTWILEVMNILGADWKQSLDYVSTHLYPPNTDPTGGEAEGRALEFKKLVIDRYGVEVWNTETGVWDEGFYKTANSSFGPTGEPMRPFSDGARYIGGSYYEAERMLDNFVHCLGNGLTKYFYYDSRIYANPSYQKSHPTMLEYDDSIRSKGIALGIAGSFLDGSRGLGNISPNTNSTYAYLFERGGKPTVVIWAKDSLPKRITLSNSVWKAFDMMGNPIAPADGSIPFGRTQVYLTGEAMSMGAASNIFLTASVASRPDVVPPNLSIDDFPVGVADSSRFTFRWTGIDDVSVPSASEENAVVYSYRIEGYSDWSAWSPAVYVNYRDVPNGAYVFQVRARDAAGNVSPVASRSFLTTIGGLRPAAPSNLRVIQ